MRTFFYIVNLSNLNLIWALKGEVIITQSLTALKMRHIIDGNIFAERKFINQRIIDNPLKSL